MTIAITQGTVRNEGGGVFSSVESLDASTATTPQAISIVTDVTNLGASTATGDNRNNLYTLAAGPAEGKEKTIFMTGTGEAAVFVPMATGRLPFGDVLLGTSTATETNTLVASATGFLVFTASDQYVMLRMINSQWAIMALAGATLSTGT